MTFSLKSKKHDVLPKNAKSMSSKKSLRFSQEKKHKMHKKQRFFNPDDKVKQYLNILYVSPS